MTKHPEYWEKLKEARSLVRTWADTPGKSEEVAKQILDVYIASEDEKLRMDCGLLLAMIYDLRTPVVAEECACSGFGIKKSRGMSVGEMIFIDGYSFNEDFYWKKKIRQTAEDYEYSCTFADRLHLEGVVAQGTIDRVMTLYRNEKDKTYIHICRTVTGDLRLIAVNMALENFIVDEETFGKEMPRYFTSTYHFVSPVFLVNAMGNIIDFILKEIGYPPVRIIRSVVFPNKVIAIDREKSEEDYWAGIDFHCCLKGETLYNEYLRQMSESIMLELNEMAVCRVLVNALKSASFVFRTLYEEKTGLLALTDKKLKKIVSKLKILY